MSEEAQSKPSIGMMQKAAPVLLVLAIGLAFAVGVLWQKVSSLEKGAKSGTADTAEVDSPISVTNIKKMAKELKLNSKNFDKCLDEGKYAQAIKDQMAEGAKVGVSGTPAFFINGRWLGGAYPFEAFKEIIDKELADKGSKNYKDYSELLQTAYSVDKPEQRSFDPAPKEISLGDSPVLGDANAKVTLVEFSDFECPYCARHYTQTSKQIITEYVNTGKVKMYFKNFPLAFHKQAQKAAEAAECAKEQGKFWEMHDRLFEASSTASQ